MFNRPKDISLNNPVIRRGKIQSMHDAIKALRNILNYAPTEADKGRVNSLCFDWLMLCELDDLKQDHFFLINIDSAVKYMLALSTVLTMTGENAVRNFEASYRKIIGVINQFDINNLSGIETNSIKKNVDSICRSIISYTLEKLDNRIKIQDKHAYDKVIVLFKDLNVTRLEDSLLKLKCYQRLVEIAELGNNIKAADVLCDEALSSLNVINLTSHPEFSELNDYFNKKIAQYMDIKSYALSPSLKERRSLSYAADESSSSEDKKRPRVESDGEKASPAKRFKNDKS